MTSTPTINPPLQPHPDTPTHRARLEEAWRRHVAEITRLSLQALDTLHAPDDEAGTSRIGELTEATKLIAAERHLLDEVEAALRRLDDGSYGQCPQCLRAIPSERLARFPAARYCALCQS
jgi:RNA polymerase-binding transcription factor DksA